jgi:hypothetical protein
MGAGQQALHAISNIQQMLEAYGDRSQLSSFGTVGVLTHE